ncbi:MAG: FAD-dependent oxidoreductase [Planctomycetota bacterium]|nr:FAD-dependent oxidoreductase [Planctomycetota bacterium]
MNENTADIEKTYECDVLVIGSGVAGYCAAIQAGRCGCETVLIEKDEVLGGNSGPNLGVGITGADRFNHYATETGIIQELQEEAAWVGAFTAVTQGTMPYSISRRNEAVVQEFLERAGVRLLKRHYARRPITEDNRITGVIAEDLASFRTVQINVRHVVVEASGDGEMAARAGADFDVGSEAQSEYGERSAPAEREDLVQGTSLVAIAYQAEREVHFQPPPDTPPFVPRIWQGAMGGFLKHHDGFFKDNKRLIFLYVTEAGGDMDTIRNDGEIYERLLKQLWAEWDHIKNGPHREQSRNWDLLWVSPKAGKRESRRFMGDYVLTQTDLEEGKLFPDDIAYGGHDFDDHRPLRGHGNIYTLSVPPLYGIPFRCCYSRNVDNLLLAGRLISATHLAHSSHRVMRTGGAIGHAVGLAAGLCCKHGCSPRAICEHHLNELQTGLLFSDGTLLNRPVPSNADLARNATATATSELRFNGQSPGQRVPLVAPAGNILWDWPARIEAVELFLRNESKEEQELLLAVFRTRREPKWKTMDEYHDVQCNDLGDEAFLKLATIPFVLPAGSSGWHRVEIPESLEVGEKDPLSDDDRLLIAIDSINENVTWSVCEENCELAEMVEHRHHSPAWSPLGCTGTMRLDPPPPLGEAANVLDGFHRRFSRGPTHLWISEPGAGLPQSLTLTWDGPVTFDEVALVFDNLPRHRHDNPWECGRRVLDMCVNDYAVEVMQAGEWRAVVKESNNYHRFGAHHFDPVTTDRLRLTIFACHGENESARVYQVRVYSKEKETD